VLGHDDRVGLEEQAHDLSEVGEPAEHSQRRHGILERHEQPVLVVRGRLGTTAMMLILSSDGWRDTLDALNAVRVEAPRVEQQIAESSDVRAQR